MIIYKYALKMEEKFSLLMQKDARIIDCQMQQTRPCLWAIIDEKALQEMRHFQWIGSGEPFEESPRKEYIKTIQISDGLAAHLFEILKDK